MGSRLNRANVPVNAHCKAFEPSAYRQRQLIAIKQTNLTHSLILPAVPNSNWEYPHV